MNKLNLILHCGGKHTSRDDLMAAPTPAATETWQPIPHIDLLNSVGETLERSGMTIVNEAHGLSKDGDRYFGMLQVMNGNNPEDYAMIVGVRNSHDKSFPAALALGAGVFVCDNLSFSGEVKLARRHTRNILRDLPGLVDRGVGLLGDHLLKDSLNCIRDIRPCFPQRWNRAGRMRHQPGHHRVAFVRRLRRQQVVQCDRKTVDVAAGVGRLGVHRLLG